MKNFKNIFLPIILATIWISISEFLRNQFLLNGFWQDHYTSMGLSFPSAPINGAIWGLWSLIFAILIFIISKKFSLYETTIIAWIFGFVMMWIVLGNLLVLPYKILIYAIPLSILEVYIATFIIKSLSFTKQKSKYRN